MTALQALLSDWFVTGAPEPSAIYIGSYDLGLVALSVALGMLGAFAAIGISQRALPTQRPLHRLAWIALGSLAMGGGIWAMHFIGMLAFDLPCSVRYETGITLASMIPGVLASAVAFHFVSKERRSAMQTAGSSLLLGLGIGAMHYMGMAAMKLDGYVRYDPVRFGFSLIVAVVLAYVALAMRTTRPPFRFARALISAIVMGTAVAGMHYAAMSSAYFVKGNGGALTDMVVSKGEELTVAVTLVTGAWILLLSAVAGAFRYRTIANQLRASEYALQRRSRSLAMLSAGNRTLVRSINEQDLLQSMCGVAVDKGGYRMAWIGYKVDDSKKSVRPMAASGFDQGYLDNIRVGWGDDEAGHGPTGMAIRTGKIQISKDFESDTNYKLWREQALSRGYRSSISLPLVHRGETLGALMVYAAHADAFDEVELPLLEEMAADLAFGITAIRTNLAREQAESKLVRSYSLLQAAMDSTADGILVTSRSGRIESYNKKLREMWGMPDSLLEANRTDVATQFMANQLNDSETFQLRLREIDEDPDSVYSDILELKSGRILERYSAPHRFEQSVLGRVFSFRDITNQREHEKRLIHMANHDALTGLPNRNLLLDRLQLGASQVERTDQFLAVLLLDLDHFKNVNDGMGHDQGDQLLQAIALRLHDSMRAGDTVARMGGDEFVVILSGLKREEDAATVANKLLATLSEPVLVNGQELHTTASLGIAISPRDGHDAATLLKRADAAMYSAKGRGGNCFQYVTSEINEQVARRLIIAEKLRHAINRSELTLNFQPQFDAHTRSLVGAEALLRWRNEELGQVSPTEFISVAEETGLILEIGQWAAETVCMAQKAWRLAGLAPIRVAINLSARQLDDEDFPRTLPACIQLRGGNPEFLEMEITEGVLMRHPEKAASTLRAFKQQGFSIAIDDFGTGYSSLGYLKRFPIDKLKIDQSFVKDIPFNADDVAIVRAIIALAHELGVAVVAEGVETDAQLEFLREHGCDFIQGYLVGRPISAAEFDTLLREANV